MKKIILILALLVIGFLVAAFVFLKGKGHEITISRHQIDTELAKVFPAEKTYFLIFHLTGSHPEVTMLEESNRIQVTMDATLDLKIPVNAKTLAGKIIVTSGVRYDPDQAAVFLTDPVIDKVEIPEIPEKHLDKFAIVATNAGSDFLSAQPIYRLEGKDAKTTAAKLLLKRVTVKGQNLVLNLGL